MDVTLSTYFLLPAFAILAFVFRKDLLALTIASSVFQAASIVDLHIGGSTFGVPIWIPLLAVSIIADANNVTRSIPKHAEGEAGHLNRLTIISILIFFAYSIVSAFVMPFIFKGVSYTSVLSSRSSGDSAIALNSTNLTQCAYLTLGAAIFFRSAFERNTKSRIRLIEFFVNACAASAVLGIYQVISEYRGWYFPSEILYTNSTYSQLGNDVVIGLFRLTSTFTEASIAAFFFAGGFGISLVRCARPNPSIYDGIRCALFALVLSLTFSTTAYITLLIGIAYFVARISKRALRSRQAAAVGTAALAVVLAAAGITASDHSLRNTSEEVITRVLANKVESISYVERHRADRAALDLFWDTNFLGAGWGTCRASSALLELLGNSGLIGTSAFLISFLASAFMRRRRDDESEVWESALVSVVLMLSAQAIAVPDLVFPALWGMLGLLARSGTQLRTRSRPHRYRPALREKSFSGPYGDRPQLQANT